MVAPLFIVGSPYSPSLPLPRLLAHDDNWPKLSHWYQRFRALYTINGDQDLGEGGCVRVGWKHEKCLCVVFLSETVCAEVQRVVEGIITKVS